jgi:hypothetical protein
VAFDAELVFQRPDDGLDALPQPVREVARGVLVFAGRADQVQAQVGAGEELLGVLAGQASAAGEQVPHSGGSRAQPVPLVVVAQQRLRYRQAGQPASVTSGRWPGPDRVKPSEIPGW